MRESETIALAESVPALSQAEHLALRLKNSLDIVNTAIADLSAAVRLKAELAVLLGLSSGAAVHLTHEHPMVAIALSGPLLLEALKSIHAALHLHLEKRPPLLQLQNFVSQERADVLEQGIEPESEHDPAPEHTSERVAA